MLHWGWYHPYLQILDQSLTKASLLHTIHRESTISYSSQVGTSHTGKYKTRGLYYTPLRIRNLRENDKFCSKLASSGLDKHTNGLYYKSFMIVIYDRNDSDQYYKTRIMIVIDNPSLS
jgi:hypothetical protein